MASSVAQDDYLEFVKDYYDVLELMDILNIDINDIVDRFEDRIMANNAILKNCIANRG